MPETAPSAESDPVTATAAVRWVTHVWLSCGCGSDRTLSQQPAVGESIWCYWHERRETINHFRAVKQEVVSG